MARVPDDSPWLPADALRWWTEVGPRVTPDEAGSDSRDVLTLEIDPDFRD